MWLRDNAHPLALGRVIGDVVDPFVPSVSMKITYRVHRLVMINNCELRPSFVSSYPLVKVGGEDMRSFYTLVNATFSFFFNFFNSFLHT